MEQKFVIEGGVPLSGTVVPAGNKNGALPILAASVLTQDELLIRNVPRIRDVDAMLALLEHLGVTVEWRGDHDVALCGKDVDPERGVDRDLSARIRASFLLAGPLLARFGSATLPPPGGDVIGRRRLDPHLDAFRELGATVGEARDIVLEADGGKLRAGDVFMDEPSVMATENALMAAALTPGTTLIRNAACEPHVQDLARMLVKMGADIQGIGSNVLTITGADTLGSCSSASGSRRRSTASPTTASTSSFRAARSSSSAATTASTRPRSRTARGPRSPLTSRASRWHSRPSPTVRSSFSRRCSRTGCSSPTS